jgi:hypothetical protein
MSSEGKSRITPLIILLVLGAGFAASSEPAMAQARPAADGWSGFVQPDSDPRQAAREFTVDENSDKWAVYWDVLTGTGSAVYQLRHVSIVPNSESVCVDSSRATRGPDYYINYDTGQIVFQRSIPPRSTISVSYRYLPAKQQDGVVGALGIVPLRFGESVSMNLLGSYVLGQPGSSFDFSVFGLDADIKPANGLSLRSAFFVSRPVEDASRSHTGGTSLLEFNGDAPPNAESPQPGNFLLQDLAYDSGGLRFRAALQDIDQEFEGFSALTSRGGFTSDELQTLEREKGLKRKSYEIGWSPSESMSLATGFNQIEEGSESITTRALKFESGVFNLSSEFRSVSPGFTRFGSLREGPEAAQWAKEKGLDRKAITASLAPWTDAKLTYDYLAISDKPSGAETINAVKKKRVDFGWKWLSAFSSYQKVDTGFAGWGAFPNDVARQLGQAKGQTLKDFGATITPGKWLTLSTYSKRLRNDPEAFDLTQNMRTLDLALDGAKTHLNLVKDDTGLVHDSALEQGVRRRATAFDQADLFGWLGVSVFKEKTDLVGFDTPLDKRVRSEFSINCDQSRRTRLWGQYKYARSEYDVRDGVQDFRFATKFGDRLSLDARTFGVRSTVNGDTFTNTGVLEYLARGGQKLSFEHFVSEVERQGTYSGRSISFDGPITGKLHLVGGHKTVDFEPNQESGMPADSVVTKSLGLQGDFGRTKLELGVLKIHSTEQRQQLAKDFKIETRAFHHAVEFEYVGSSDANEVFSGWRSWKLASAPCPEKRMHYDLLYKVKDLPDGNRVHIRNYSVDYKLGDRFTLQGSYFRNLELPDGRINPVWGKKLTLKWSLKQDLALSVNYGHDKNLANDQATLKSGMELAGKLGSRGTLKAGYDINYARRDIGRKEIAYTLNYDYMVNADYFLTLAATYYDRSDTNPDSDPDDEVMGRLDFKFTFN